jgi:eukaryotic-like serine/threonine-protein kinase
MKLLRSVRERRVIPIVVSYAAAAWIVLEAVDQLVDRGVLPDLAYLVLLVWFLGGLAAAAIIGWNHGEKGDQDFTRGEFALLGLVIIGTLFGTAGTVQRFRAEQAVASVIDAATGLDPRRIAVLYFEDRSRDGDLSFLADGLTEGLIEELAGVQGLDVVSGNGSVQYRDSELPPDSIARLLEAGTYVSGAVEKRGDGLRVEVALMDAESGATIERSSFEQPESGALRSALAVDVSRFLRTWLSEEVRLRESRSAFVSDAAWVLVQRAERARKDGQALLDHDDAHGAGAAFERSDALLAEAQELEPGWADPPLARGRLLYERSRLEADPADADDLMRKADVFFDLTLDLDPRNADALEFRGTMKYLRWLFALEPDHDAAQLLLESAEDDLLASTSVNPQQANAWNVLGHLYYQKDDIVEANLAARRAYEADAFLRTAPDILWRLWSTSYDLENRRQSTQWCEEGRSRFPENPRFSECQLWNMTSGATDPDPDLAWALVDEVVSRTPERTRTLARLEMQIVAAGVLALASRDDGSASRDALADSARAVLDRSRGNTALDPNRELLLTQAFMRTLLDDNEEAVSLLEEYFTFNPERREGIVTHGHWWWRELRLDPAFQRIIGG